MKFGIIVTDSFSAQNCNCKEEDRNRRVFSKEKKSTQNKRKDENNSKRNELTSSFVKDDAIPPSLMAPNSMCVCVCHSLSVCLSIALFSVPFFSGAKSAKTGLRRVRTRIL